MTRPKQLRPCRPALSADHAELARDAQRRLLDGRLSQRDRDGRGADRPDRSGIARALSGDIAVEQRRLCEFAGVRPHFGHPVHRKAFRRPRAQPLAVAARGLRRSDIGVQLQDAQRPFWRRPRPPDQAAVHRWLFAFGRRIVGRGQSAERQCHDEQRDRRRSGPGKGRPSRARAPVRTRRPRQRGRLEWRGRPDFPQHRRGRRRIPRPLGQCGRSGAHVHGGTRQVANGKLVGLGKL